MRQPIRVLVVDDSAFMRHTITKYLDADPDITVVGKARDGMDALAKIPSLLPDVITLDVEMPVMDGLTTLRRIMDTCPRPVIMVSSLTQRGARTTVQALMRGAVDFVTKPTAKTDTGQVMADLMVKVKVAAGMRPDTSQPALTTPSVPTTRKSTIRRIQSGDPLVVIGASTGGPRALHQVAHDLPADLPAAVVVVQHMPSGFTQSLAQRLNEASPLVVQEASDGDRLARGLALLTPGDYHLRLRDSRQVMLDQGERRNHVRPAVDVTMESASEHFGASVIGVILTGMGSDGKDGAASIKAAGGKVIAEHESTSVVYGMPRSVVEAGLADKVVPLEEIASAIVEMVNHGSNGTNGV